MSASASFTVQTRQGKQNQFAVAAATRLYQGCFGALDGNNQLVLATDAAARRVVGLIAAEVDNSAGAAADLYANVERGLFKVANSGTNAVTDAHIGLACFIEDNETVASAAGTNAVVAGIVDKVDADGVWVWVGLPFAPAGPSTVTLTSTNGTAAAASADLAALAAEAEKIGDDVRALHAALKTRGLIK